MSFSKILAPGLRLGWVLSSAPLVDLLQKEGAMASGGGPPSLITEVGRMLMESQVLGPGARQERCGCAR